MKPRRVTISEPVVLLTVTGGDGVRRDAVEIMFRLDIREIYMTSLGAYEYRGYFREADARRLAAELVLLGYQIGDDT